MPDHGPDCHVKWQFHFLSYVLDLSLEIWSDIDDPDHSLLMKPSQLAMEVGSGVCRTLKQLRYPNALASGSS